jgi:hypothetical protein
MAAPALVPTTTAGAARARSRSAAASAVVHGHRARHGAPRAGVTAAVVGDHASEPGEFLRRLTPGRGRRAGRGNQEDRNAVPGLLVVESETGYAGTSTFLSASSPWKKEKCSYVVPIPSSALARAGEGSS